MFRFKTDQYKLNFDDLGEDQRVIFPDYKECLYIRGIFNILQGESVYPIEEFTIEFDCLKDENLSIKFYSGKENKITEVNPKEEILIYDSTGYINESSSLLVNLFIDGLDSEKLLDKQENWTSTIQYFYKFMEDTGYIEKFIMIDPDQPIEEILNREDNPIHDKKTRDKVNEVLYALDFRTEKIGDNLECLYRINDEKTVEFSYKSCGSGYLKLATMLPYFFKTIKDSNVTIFISHPTFSNIHVTLREKLLSEILFSIKGKVILSEYYNDDNVINYVNKKDYWKVEHNIYLSKNYRKAAQK